MQFEREVAVASLLFFVCIVLSDSFSTLIPAFRKQISASVALWVASSLALGGEWGLIVSTAATLVSELYLRLPHSRRSGGSMTCYLIAFNVGQVALVLGILAVILNLINAPKGCLVTACDFGKAAIAYISVVLLNSSIVSGVVALTSKQKFQYLTTEWFRDFSFQYLILGVSTLLLLRSQLKD